MARKVNYAIDLPNVGVFADPNLLAELAVATDRAGWDGFFLWDHLLYADDWPVVDPWVTLAAIPARTERIRLGLCVALLARQLPWEVAKRAVTIDQLSGGRFILGVGLGSRTEEFTAFARSSDPPSAPDGSTRRSRSSPPRGRGCPLPMREGISRSGRRR